MIKFENQQSLPPSAFQEMLTDIPHPNGLTYANFIRIGNETYRLEVGDYISQDKHGNPTELITAAVAIEQAERIALELGADLKQTIRQAIKQLALTNAQRADLVNRILAVYVLIDDGDLQAAKFMAENTPTGGSYTAGRQTQLVSLISNAIQQLP